MRVSSSAPFAPCKLCETPASLHESHVFSKWFFRRAIHTGDGSSNLVVVRDGKADLSREEFTEFMLCSSCETRFHAWETYVSNVALLTNDRFPARDAVRIIPSLSSPELVVADASALDTDSIVRFAVSLIWRASQSAHFPLVSLGKRYHRVFARYLLDDTVPASSLPPKTRLIVRFYASPKSSGRVDHVGIPPFSGNVRGRYHQHECAGFGMHFTLAVGSELPEPFDEICFAATKRVLLSDDAHLREKLAPSMLTAIKSPALERYEARRQR